MFYRSLLATVVLCATGCVPVDVDADLGQSDSQLGEKPWGPQDHPNLLDSSMEYTFAALPTSGAAKVSPWAGNYWPTYRDNLNYPWEGPGTDAPTTKYAKAFGRTGLEDRVSKEYGIDSRSTAKTCTETSQCDSKLGESCAKRVGETEGRCIPTWFGICHAWAPAAIMEPEPEQSVEYNGVTFKVNDIKALVSLHYDEGLQTKFMSLRCNEDLSEDGEVVDGTPVDAQCQDTNAGSFHVAVTNLVGLQEKSLVEDRTIDYEVWNQPIRHYNMTKNSAVSASQAMSLLGQSGSSYTFNSAAKSFRHVNMKLGYITESGQSTDGNFASTIDSYTKYDYYDYIVELDANGRIIGGEWIGSSRTNHPDFLWLPTKKTGSELAKAGSWQAGTGIKWSDVEMLLGLSMKGNGGGDSGGDSGGFDWGSACEDGSGAFQQQIEHQATVTVGTIPTNKADVRVNLQSSKDVDIQLVDKSTGHEIVAWPNGDLNAATQGCTTYSGVQYCYSGYNGVNGQLGNEWIEIRGTTNRDVVMKAFGYAAGHADVNYSWKAPVPCVDAGSGSFQQEIAHQDVVKVGDIPTGKSNIKIELSSNKDVDIQLFAGNTKLVQWPDGMLNGAGEDSLNYQGMTITYSGYNGTNGQLGNEFITIEGEVSTTLTMKAFGYASGYATVDYAWGLDASEL